MKIAVLGTGVVGETIAGKLVDMEHEVRMGSRTADNDKAVAWAARAGARASHGTFADAATFGALVFNCVNGDKALAALRAAGAANLAGKVLVDVANRLQFTPGKPPLSLARDGDSLAEELQREFPEAKVVKSLNTMNCRVMVNPALVPGDHDVFLSGNDAGAKTAVRELLRSFGWKDRNILDLGDVTTARGPEGIMPLWLRVFGAFGDGVFNLHWVRGG